MTEDLNARSGHKWAITRSICYLALEADLAAELSWAPSEPDCTLKLGREQHRTPPPPNRPSHGHEKYEHCSREPIHSAKGLPSTSPHSLWQGEQGCSSPAPSHRNGAKNFNGRRGETETHGQGLLWGGLSEGGASVRRGVFIWPYSHSSSSHLVPWGQPSPPLPIPSHSPWFVRDCKGQTWK